MEEKYEATNNFNQELLNAAEKGDATVVRSCIAGGADVNARDLMHPLVFTCKLG